MNFDLSEEQTMIQDSVARFVQDNYELENRTKLVASKYEIAPTASPAVKRQNRRSA